MNEPPNMLEPSLTVKDVAALEGVRYERVIEWLGQKWLKGYRTGPRGSWRILPSDLSAFRQKFCNLTIKDMQPRHERRRRLS